MYTLLTTTTTTTYSYPSQPTTSHTSHLSTRVEVPLHKYLDNASSIPASTLDAQSNHGTGPLSHAVGLK